MSVGETGRVSQGVLALPFGPDDGKVVPELGEALGAEPVGHGGREGLLIEGDAGRPKEFAQTVVGNVTLVEDELAVLGDSKARRPFQLL